MTFGATAATGFAVNSDTQITAMSPAESAATVDVTVTTPLGTSSTSSADQFSFSSGGGGGISTGAVSTNSGGYGSTAGITWSASTTTGSTLVVGIFVQTGFSVTTPSGWTLLYTTSVGMSAELYVFAAYNAALQSGQSFTLSSPADWGAVGIEVTNPTGSNYDQLANNSGTSSTASVSTGTLSHSSEVGVGIVCCGGSLNQSPSGGFTFGTGNSFGGVEIELMYKVVSATSALSTGDTTYGGASDPWAAVLATFY